ncbi:MAG: hypothetical protein CL674_04740 [Bdellovibrionaceae bacterium]|nr:hypothetical protein [Pseudobdellovibrionaceae bacterium]|tara:strand:+ start:91212 stop:93116 length:1905 start_codon:yes stop_codon:yes gene_type:complete
MINLLKVLPIFLGAVFVAISYREIELQKYLDIKKQAFLSYNSQRVLVLQKKLDQKKSNLNSIQAFFQSSTEVSEKDFHDFIGIALKSSPAHQVCWTDLKSTQKFIVNSNYKDFCENLNILSRTDLYTKNSKHWVMLSSLTKGRDGKNLGVVFYYFPIEELFINEILPFFRIDEKIVVIDTSITKAETVYKSSEEEFDEPEQSFLKEVFSFDSFKLIYESSIPKSNWKELSVSRINVISGLLGALLFLIGIVIQILQRLNRRIKKEVAAKTLDLQKSNEKLELTVEGAGVGIWQRPNCDEDTMLWSQRFQDLLGVKKYAEKRSYQEFIDRCHSEDRENLLEKIEQARETGGSFELECRFMKDDGDYHWFYCTGKHSQKTKGKQSLVGGIQDINSRVLFEIELKASNEELDQFAYIASHDLREPLRGMRNFSQFLVEDYSDRLDEEGISYLNTIQKLAGRLEKYLDSLLFFSRLGRQSNSYSEVDLKQLLLEIAETYTSTSNNQIQVELEGEFTKIYCDPVKLQIIVGNLIQNAIRYNLNEVKLIRLKYQSLPGNYHQFELADNGIGIEEEHFERIFTIFKRLHPRDEFEGGSGVGLTLVKKAVEKHGGEIRVKESVLGKGTVIYFTIKGQKDETN